MAAETERFQDRYAIVPAAGRSRRMGTSKLLLPWGSGRLIERTLATWCASRVTRTVVVVRSESPELAALCRAFDVDVVVAESPAEMKDSVRIGLAYLARRYNLPGEAAWLLAPADLVGLTSGLIDRLLAASAAAPDRIHVPIVAGRRAHPVVFPWRLVGDVEALAANEGLNVLVRRHGACELTIEEPLDIIDIDTPDDYRRLLGSGTTP